MKKEIVDKAIELKEKIGEISVPFLQQKLKLSYRVAFLLIKKVNGMK